MGLIKKIAIALSALLLLAGGWVYGSPLWTLRAMRNAAVAKDAAALSAYVDYDALRADLKGDMRRSIVNEVRGQADNPFAEIGMAIAMRLADPMIDAMVTPEGVEAMFAQQRKADGARKAPGAEPEGGAAPQPTAPVSLAKPTIPNVATGDHPTIHHISLNEFRVRDPANKGALIFRRRKLGWKLSGVDIRGL